MSHKVAQPPFRIEERKKLGAAYRIVWHADYETHDVAFYQFFALVGSMARTTGDYEPDGTHVLVLLGRDRTVA